MPNQKFLLVWTDGYEIWSKQPDTKDKASAEMKQLYDECCSNSNLPFDSDSVNDYSGDELLEQSFYNDGSDAILYTGNDAYVYKLIPVRI